MKKRIVLCADDYGQVPAISQGILQLIQLKRLSATSCIVTAPMWAAEAKALLPHKNQIDIGLHFNLTDGCALSSIFKQKYGEQFPALSRLLMKAFFLQLDQSCIEAELHMQLDYFEQAFSCLPAFIDGHQHIHQFPVIRDALLHVYKQRLQGVRPYLRLVNPSKTGPYWLKKNVIYATGAHAWAKLLTMHRIPHNTSFAGIYDFAQARMYPALFPHFLAEVKEGGLIMCHPGQKVVTSNLDPIRAARSAEYCYFASEQFIADCERAQIEIQPF